MMLRETTGICLFAGRPVRETCVRAGDKKNLRQILGIFSAVSSPPNKRIKRIPVESAKVGQGRSRTGRLTLSREQDDAPMRGSKPAGFIIRQPVFRIHPQPRFYTLFRYLGILDLRKIIAALVRYRWGRIGRR